MLCFHRRAQPSEKLNNSLFSMHLCSDYMNFDLWRAVAISFSVQHFPSPFPTGFLFHLSHSGTGECKILKLTFHRRYLLQQFSSPSSPPSCLNSHCGWILGLRLSILLKHKWISIQSCPVLSKRRNTLMAQRASFHSLWHLK